MAVERKFSMRYSLTMRRSLIPILLSLIFCGCAHDKFKRGDGEVGNFILKETATFVPAAKIVSTNNLPSVSREWHYSQDQYGVIIRMPKECYPSLEVFLRAAFGNPSIEPEGEEKLGVYRLTPKGGAIQFLRDNKMTQAIIIRPLTQEEFGKALM